MAALLAFQAQVLLLVGRGFPSTAIGISQSVGKIALKVAEFINSGTSGPKPSGATLLKRRSANRLPFSTAQWQFAVNSPQPFQMRLIIAIPKVRKAAVRDLEIQPFQRQRLHMTIAEHIVAEAAVAL
jgi:hypothetical protein